MLDFTMNSWPNFFQILKSRAFRSVSLLGASVEMGMSAYRSLTGQLGRGVREFAPDRKDLMHKSNKQVKFIACKYLSEKEP